MICIHLRMQFLFIFHSGQFTITLDDNGEDSLQLDLKTEMASSPKLLMRHLVKKGKKKPEAKKEQYESLEGMISRMKRS